MVVASTLAVPLSATILGLAALALLGCGHETTKPGPVIKELSIEGAHQVSARRIRKKIATAATGWWWPFARKQYFDPVTWQSDLRRIERFYESEGFYQAEVTADAVKPVKGGVELKAVVSEGPPTHVAAFEVKGVETLTQAERAELVDDLGMAGGDVFHEAAWETAKDRIRARLRNLGFAQADLDAQALVDVTKHEANLLIAARPGPRCRFGAIEVKGGPHFHLEPVWIWEQVRLAIPEGERYSDEALVEAQRRVFAMGLFAVVKVSVGAPGPDDRVPVIADVREAPFRMVRAGGGVRIDQVRNEARLVLEWSNRNFLGGMRNLSAHTEAGWAFIPNTYAVLRNQTDAGPRNGPIARVNLALEQPRFLGRPSLRWRNTLDLERTLEQAYDALGGRLATGIAWQPRSSVTVYPTYNIQGTYVNGPPIASASAAPLTLGCSAGSNHCFILLSYLDQTLTWDRRDAPLEARKGFYTSLSLQEGGGPLGGDFTYLRVLPEVRGYLSFGDDDELTLAARARLGELIPSGGESAVVTRFYGGGGIAMRGFNDRRLSPLLRAPAPVSPGAAPVTLTLPIGGDGIVEGSFEARYQMTASLVLAAFVDFGQVTRGRLGPDDLPTVMWAVGLGIRYLTPIGPIRVDLARRLQYGRPPSLFAVDPVTGVVSDMPYQVDDSCFGLGGSGRSTVVGDNLCVFHLAIGEAF